MSPFEGNPLLEGHVDREGLAKIFGVTVRTISRWYTQENGVPHIRLGGRIIFNIESVRKWIAKQERSIAPPPRRMKAQARSAA